MLKQELVTLGNETYNISQLPLLESRSLLIKLTNLLGPSLGEAIKGEGDDDEDVDSKVINITGESIGEAIKTLSGQLSDEDFSAIQEAVLKHVSWVNPQGDEIPMRTKGFADEHFAGGSGLARLLRLIVEALKVNYSDFLAEVGLGDLIQANNPLENLQK